MCMHTRKIYNFIKNLQRKFFIQSRGFFREAGNVFPALFPAESLFVDCVFSVKIRIRKNKGLSEVFNKSTQL